ncbi:alternate signal-mediated exported protein [Breznakia sp. PF5-3]|uniref:BsaA family SipW-dependent biofilm matrix protein n=1 Tax=unclassified Breznakia TaxID=2623764 RepID=UPI00240494E5|nr:MULTISPECIES: BsaA family SipW-dependent biofilm matrix protein [unclassified Breznakia]MDF9824914.1 alternate signal-mediated exported protein [Breznakia sp. PM6-1]MDF9835587.1 alternate signal-mediated exported protein [Breznakia sp. PF5-3]MDF9837997.1 alternate signal-mediated exported protein [Breznakia sp. PFB2-8]MDF9859986.1 alternate signal-mediated exported protein [Breznakia sp. PH5-24]
MNENKKSKKSKITLGAGVLALVLVLSSTFLWFTAKDEIENIFNFDVFDVVITEKFNPEPVVPGTEINKEVGVQNKGNADAAVRVKIKKELILMELDQAGNIEIGYNTSTTLGKDQIIVKMSDREIADLKASGYNDVTASVGAPSKVLVFERKQSDLNGTGGEKVEYFAYLNDGTNRLVQYDPVAKTFKYAYYVQDTTNAKLGFHGKTTTPDADFAHAGITLKFASTASTDWSLDPNTGWYYYTKLLAGNETTTSLLEKVEFASSLGNEYKGAIFKVTPMLEAIQADQSALDDNGWNATISGKTVTVK